MYTLTIEDIYTLINFKDEAAFQTASSLYSDPIRKNLEYDPRSRILTKDKSILETFSNYAEAIQFQRYLQPYPETPLNWGEPSHTRFDIYPFGDVLMSFSQNGELYVGEMKAGFYKAGERYTIPLRASFDRMVYRVEDPTRGPVFSTFQRWASPPPIGGNVFWWTDSLGKIPYFLSQGSLAVHYDRDSYQRLEPF